MDKELLGLLKKEIKRQEEVLNLIPSENIASKEVMLFLGSELTNKYAEGYSKLRYYGGNEYVDLIEDLTKRRALDLFNLSPKKWAVNVQAYSGSSANLAVYMALVPLGEKIMGLELNMGGHLTHGHKVSLTGKAWKPVVYGLDPKTELLNYGEIREIALKEKPKLIVAGYTAYPRKIDFKKFREIADEVGAYLLADISHISGLIAGGVHPSPFPYADVVTSTTHKTLRGPRAALIYSRVDISRGIDRAIFPGLQGGPHLNQIAAICESLYEAKKPSFKKYAKQVVLNSKALAAELKSYGWRVISGGTDNHLLLIDVAEKGLGGKEAGEMLEKQGIVVNKNTIPFDKRSPVDPSGVRLGTPVLTSRGMKEREMKKIASIIDKVLKGGDVKKEVRVLCSKFRVKKSY